MTLQIQVLLILRATNYETKKQGKLQLGHHEKYKDYLYNLLDEGKTIPIKQSSTEKTTLFDIREVSLKSGATVIKVVGKYQLQH
ncbi:MAG: hypothetical protein ACRC0A_06995 [Chitinophagaceae bacterium]